jgi:hypothetical protein
MRTYVLLSAVSVVLFAACSESLPNSRQLGAFDLRDTTDGAGGYVTNPTAVFWQASNFNLANSQVAPDSCLVVRYFPPDTVTAVLSNQLDAGAPIQVQTSLQTANMSKDTLPNGLQVYKSPTFGISHVPGGDVIFTVPGAPGGFPAAVLHAVTPKILVIGPIDTLPTDSLHLTWTAGPAGTKGAVNMNLLFSRNNTTKPDSVIECSMLDDGDFWVNRKIASSWAGANGFYRTVQAFRWITTFNSLSTSSLMAAIARFDTVKTTFP